MSVSVTVDIAGGSAYRSMRIECTSMPTLDEYGHRDLNEEGTYLVEIASQPAPRDHLVRQSTFTHRYGDDVFTLIEKAAAAVRADHGRI